MQRPFSLSALLQQPGTLLLTNNLPFATESGLAQVSMQRQPEGHVVVYGPHGRRILFTDPGGYPLHECEWEQSFDGGLRFVSARLFLDWNHWVGIKPSGLVNTMTMDLSTRPGWQRLTLHDFRLMAAQTMGVSVEEVGFFYTDDDVQIDPAGWATIRQRKDALYSLNHGTFDQACFMSCMSAMHWDAIDYLPVVELFQSLLPGTGSAAFELIRGLYDDQNPSHPRSLRYRGIPTYPSEAAFGLFSQYFMPSVEGPERPRAVFMDTRRAHEVSWLPNPHPPVRFVDSSQHACVTVKQGTIQKVTIATDSTGLPFFPPDAQGFAPCARTVAVYNGQLVLEDQRSQTTLTLSPTWGVTGEQLGARSSGRPMAFDWRNLFPEGVPFIAPHEAFSAVLLYPDDDSVIEDYATQPFVADFLDDLFEQESHFVEHKAKARRVLIHGFEASLRTCGLFDQPRSHTILFTHAALVQKQAQLLWNQLARDQRLDSLPLFQFLPAATTRYAGQYDWVYRWIPFAELNQDAILTRTIQDIVMALAAQGMAFVTGPASMPALIANLPVRILFGERGDALQSFTMHRSVLPKSRINPLLHIWGLQKI